MANPFYVAPATPDMTPVFQGLGALAKQTREAKQKATAHKAFMEAYNSKDPEATAKLFAEYPEMRQAFVSAMGAKNDITSKNMLDSTREILSNPDRAEEIIQNRINLVNEQGGNPAETMASLEQLRNDPQGFMQSAEYLYSGLASPQEWEAYKARHGLLSSRTSASQQEFENLIKDMSPEDQEKARRVKAGLDPRAVGSADLTIAGSGMSEQVGESKAIIKQREKFGEMTGASRAKAIDTGFEKITQINTNMFNIDRAIKAIEGGAGTGAIQKYLPSIKAASVELQNIQNELALDVIGSVTFGALSKGELDLAKETALPTGLDGPDLVDYLKRRKDAQEKLKAYFMEQINFLDEGGSVAGFLRMKERGSASDQDAAQPESTNIDDLVNKYAN